MLLQVLLLLLQVLLLLLLLVPLEGWVVHKQEVEQAGDGAAAVGTEGQSCGMAISCAAAATPLVCG